MLKNSFVFLSPFPGKHDDTLVITRKWFVQLKSPPQNENIVKYKRMLHVGIEDCGVQTQW